MNPDNFHLFTHRQQWYLFKIDSGDAFRITEDLAALIGQIKNETVNCANCTDLNIAGILSAPACNHANPEEKCSHNGVKNSMLTSLSLNVAQDCNMRCKYCYGRGGTYLSSGYMQFETACAAIDWLADNSDRQLLSLIFFGGEPLLNFNLIKDIIDYIEHSANLRKRQFRFSITTNGTLFTREITSFLNKYKFNVTISFDGDKRIQNYNRPMRNGCDSYHIVRKNIKRFLKSRDGNAFARATVTSGCPEWNVISHELRQTGFKRYDYAAVTAERSALFALSDQDHQRLYKDLARQADVLISDYQKQGPGAAIRIWDMILALKSYKNKCLGCGAGRSLLAVSSQGRVYPCHRFVGNKSVDFGDINKFNHYRQSMFLRQRCNGFEQCMNCWARLLCGGGCLHDNYTYSGFFDRPDPRFCTEIKRRIEMAIYAYDRLKYKRQIS